MPKIIITAITLSIPFSILNFSAYMKGIAPDFTQVLSSSLFVFLWFISSLFSGYLGKFVYLKAATSYWVVGMLVVALGYFAHIGVVFVPSVLIFAGPLYGLKHYLGTPPGILLVSYTILINYTLIIVGYLAGKHLKKIWLHLR
ncbi:hypothetical protein [Paenibacillus sp. YYML68]|uniref:hypothetical protein n=1 Tax=Paenibacillus sp. YYML68 TaxID=2909250 RepID=UPI002493116E|nr:hypothetical protein [Paenibacillus sp. YYML68]